MARTMSLGVVMPRLYRGRPRADLEGVGRYLDDLGDLASDELVAGDQRVAQRDHNVVMLLEERDHALALGREDLLHLLLPDGVRQDLAHEVLAADRTLRDRVEADQGAGHPERPHHLRGQRRGGLEIGRGPGARLPEEYLLGCA